MHVFGRSTQREPTTVLTTRPPCYPPGGQTKCIPYKTDLKAEPKLPQKKITMNCQLISVSCAKRKVNIFVRNTTQYDITIPSKTVTGNLQRITDSYLVQLEKKQVSSIAAETPQAPACPLPPNHFRVIPLKDCLIHLSI